MKKQGEFVRGLGLFSATNMVIGVMIGSGIFIVSADAARQVGSPALLLLVWAVVGVMTVSSCLIYGELACMFPHAGGNISISRRHITRLADSSTDGRSLQ